MNKIFKVIWNHATQSWTVVSELSKAYKKQSSVKQVAKLSVLAASFVTASGVMAAESAKPVITAYDRGGLAIGTDHVTDQSLNGATQTQGATVTAYDGIAMGNGSHAGGENGQGGNGHIAIGLMAKATGNGANISQAAVALGSYSRALGGSSTALGQQAYAGIDTNRGSYQNNGNFTTAVGAEAKAMGQSTTALGMQAQATYDRATALGRSAQATSNHATAVGTSAAASKQATVALGTFSKADADFAIAIGGATTSNPNRAGQYQAAKASGNSSISIGIITETTGSNAIAIGRESAAKSNHSVAIGYKASSTNSQYATAIGSESAASAQFAFAAGPKSIANIQDGVALGSDSKTTVNKGVSGFNQNTTTRNERSVLNKYASLTDKTLTSTKAGVSVGSETHTRQINNLAAGTVDTDAVNVAQLKSVNLQIAGDETANNGADVRLWDQGLTVKGEDGGVISTKADNNTITIKVNTGSIKPAEESGDNKGKVTVADDKDKNKVATVENVANAINSAKWFAKANNLETTMTDRAEKGEESASIGAGDEITFEADKNLAVKRNGKTFTYGLAKDIEVDSVTAKNKVTLGEGDKAVQLSADAGALKVADKDGNATQITNVDAGANTMEFDKDGNQLVNVDGTYYVVDPETGLIKLDDSNNPVKGTPATDEELEALGAANPTLKSFVAYANAASGLANLENSIETNALTVADAKNLGWVVSASGNNYAASVTNAREVRFNGVNGVKVTGETDEATGVRNINIGLEAGNVGAEEGNTGKVTGDTNYVTGDQVANAINNSGWKTQATKVVDADGNEVANADKSTAVNPGDTVNYVDGKGTKANVAVTKVDGQPDVVNVSYDLNLNNHLTPVDNTTKSVTKAPFDAGTTGKEAATVNDVLNAGWNLKANNEDVDAVTHADAVNFTSDDGSVVITPTTDGKTTKLNFSVDKASVANSVVASTKGNASVNSTTGKAVVGKDGNADTTAGADAKFATTGDVVNTINNTGWKTKATDGTDVTVNPGDAVNYVDGKGTKANVAVTKVDGQDVVNVSYDVKSADTDTLTVDANGVKVNTGSLVNASTAEGDANRGKVTVNAGDENKVATVKNVADAINSAAWTVKVADSQEAIETSTANDKGASVSAGTTVTHTAGKNLKVKRDGNNVTYALANDVSVNTVTTETATVGKGDAATTISTSKAGDNVTEVKFGDNAGKPVRVTNVANGVKDGDAVYVRQLNDAKANIHQNTQAIGKLNDKIDQVEKRGRKGTAIAGAIGMLPQPHTSGKSMVGVATTNYRGEQAVAVGYSRLSDNGKHIIKLSGSSNVSGKKDAMVGAAYGFQW